MQTDEGELRQQLAAQARERLRASLTDEEAALDDNAAAVRADLRAFLARLAEADGGRPR